MVLIVRRAKVERQPAESISVEIFVHRDSRVAVMLRIENPIPRQREARIFKAISLVCSAVEIGSAKWAA
jgi:translation elongation factor EF-Ts